jgi:hypothetical protein
VRSTFFLSAIVAAVVLFAAIKTVVGQPAPSPPTEQQILAATIGNLFQENARFMVDLQKAQALISQLQKEKASSEAELKAIITQLQKEKAEAEANGNQ